MDALVYMNPAELFQQKPVIPKPSLETEASLIFFVPKAPIHFACSETWDCNDVGCNSSKFAKCNAHRPNNRQIEKFTTSVPSNGEPLVEYVC